MQSLDVIAHREQERVLRQRQRSRRMLAQQGFDLTTISRKEWELLDRGVSGGATDPVFAATIQTYGAIAPATADTSLTAPTNVSTLATAGSSGSKIEQIRVQQIATLSATTLCNIFLYNGSTYYFFDVFTFATLTLSTTAEAAAQDKFFQNLVVKNGWSVRVTVPAAGGQSAFAITAFGGDF